MPGFSLSVEQDIVGDIKDGGGERRIGGINGVIIGEECMDKGIERGVLGQGGRHVRGHCEDRCQGGRHFGREVE